MSGLPIEPRIILPDGEGYPILNLVIDRSKLGMSGFELASQLKQGDPGIFVNEKLLTSDTLVIHPINLDSSQTELLTAQLRKVLS